MQIFKDIRYSLTKPEFKSLRKAFNLQLQVMAARTICQLSQLSPSNWFLDVSSSALALSAIKNLHEKPICPATSVRKRVNVTKLRQTFLLLTNMGMRSYPPKVTLLRSFLKMLSLIFQLIHVPDLRDTTSEITLWSRSGASGASPRVSVWPVTCLVMWTAHWFL